MTDVFGDLVGQDEAVAMLRRAAASAAALLRAPVTSPAGGYDDLDALAEEHDGDPGPAPADPGAGMTHAWIFTGPPGSGRSVAARAFAAALECVHGTGCGTCPGCHTTLTGTHADVRLVVPEGLSIGVNEMRALVLRAASAPSGGRWQIVIIEDADRLTEAAGNALLKAIEEPPPRTVFLLCAPSTHPDDVSVTIRSRCRVVPLRQPPPAAVAEVLVRRDGIAPDGGVARICERERRKGWIAAEEVDPARSRAGACLEGLRHAVADPGCEQAARCAGDDGGIDQDDVRIGGEHLDPDDGVVPVVDDDEPARRGVIGGNRRHDDDGASDALGDALAGVDRLAAAHGHDDVSARSASLGRQPVDLRMRDLAAEAQHRDARKGRPLPVERDGIGHDHGRAAEGRHDFRQAGQRAGALNVAAGGA